MRELRGLIFTNEKCFKPGSVIIDKGIIQKVKLLENAELTAVERERLIIPGLVDIHMHGAAGVDICRDSLKENSEECFERLIAFERGCGVTSFFPATMTLPVAELKQICRKISRLSALNGAVKGIYLEGPFVSEKKCGAQNPGHVLKPDYETFMEINRAADDRIRFVTLAPEAEGADAFIREWAGEKILCLGHSTADYNCAEKAFEAGALQVTHLYNAMNFGSSREPGIPGAAAEHKLVRVELIADGIHLHPVTVKNAFTLYKDRVILISDSTEATGQPDGEYLLGDKVIFKQGREARLEDGTLAGSASSLYDCLLSAVGMGVPLEEAVAAATVNPARAAGIFDIAGSLEVGKRADILILNKELELEEVLYYE